VHRGYQLKTATKSVLGSSVLVVLLAIVLYQINLQTSLDLQQMAPFMKAHLESRDRLTLVSICLAGAVFLTGVFLLEVLETHRTAGVILNLRRRLDELRSGRLSAFLRLRRHDCFRELETAFNATAGALRTRAEGDIAALGRLSSLARELLQEHEKGNSTRVRALGEALREALEEMRCRKAELLEP
jgi:methyl-accepting chemotaxis protein